MKVELSHWTTIMYEGRAKSLCPNMLNYNFFTIYISVKRAFFTDSYESAADMASL